MEKRAHNECCYRMLAMINVLKEKALEKTELENLLSEINRLVTMVTSEEPAPVVKVEKIGERGYLINSTHIEEQDGEIKIIKTDVLKLSSYFQTLPLRKQPIEEAIEYIKAVNERRICMACLKRASPNTLLCPLVMKKKNTEILMYHIDCAEERLRLQSK